MFLYRFGQQSLEKERRELVSVLCILAETRASRKLTATA